MERHEIMEAMTELKLYGMRAGFDEITGKGLARRDDIYPLVASLIRAAHPPSGAFDQLSHRRRQVPGPQGSRRVHLYRHANRRKPGARARHRQLS